MADYANHLFSYVPPQRLGTFSYGHVIPPTNLVAQSLTKGLMGSDFDFTFEARGSEKMVSSVQATPLQHSHPWHLDYRPWTDHRDVMSGYSGWCRCIFPKLRLSKSSIGCLEEVHCERQRPEYAGSH